MVKMNECTQIENPLWFYTGITMCVIWTIYLIWKFVHDIRNDKVHGPNSGEREDYMIDFILKLTGGNILVGMIGPVILYTIIMISPLIGLYYLGMFIIKRRENTRISNKV